MICGKENDRIFGNGTTLQFVFDIDDIYKRSTEKILNYFNTNYNGLYRYIKRLEYVHDIYRENEDLDRETIENETCEYILIKLININTILYYNYLNLVL